jgi:hypothetical protein
MSKYSISENFSNFPHGHTAKQIDYCLFGSDQHMPCGLDYGL